MGKGLQAMIEEAGIPESFKVGQMERTHQYLTNKKDFVESTLKPDFTFREGMGEKPEKPHSLSLIPIGKVQYPDLYPSKILWVNY